MGKAEEQQSKQRQLMEVSSAHAIFRQAIRMVDLSVKMVCMGKVSGEGEGNR